MEIPINQLRAVKNYVIQPLWDKHQTKGGVILEIGYQINDKMPAWYWPTEGTVIASNSKLEAQKGDTLYFTWNALSFHNGCISQPEDQNLFVIKHSYYAYLNEGQLYSMEGFLLLEAIEEKEEEQITESGIILSGYAVKGSGLEDAEIVHKTVKKNLHGKIAFLPKELPYDGLYNAHTQLTDKIEAGLLVVCENTSDVPVSIDGKTYYRTRFDELIYSYGTE